VGVKLSEKTPENGEPRDYRDQSRDVSIKHFGKKTPKKIIYTTDIVVFKLFYQKKFL
jgi:hypothetical protein